MSKDIFRNKVDFAREEFATEIPDFILQGRPKPREAKSQIAQMQSGVKNNLRKDKKVPMREKLK